MKVVSHKVVPLIKIHILDAILAFSHLPIQRYKISQLVSNYPIISIISKSKGPRALEP